MAQVNSVTQELYKHIAASINANSVVFLCCDSGNMDSFTEATNAPATEITTNGFTRQAGTKSIVTTTVSNDTFQTYYVYTATANQNVNGHELMSANASGNMYGYCKYNATQVMQTNDTINCIMQIQSKNSA